MPSLTPPKAQVPIGTLWINGREFPVAIHPEWLRFLGQGLFDRAGGVQGQSTTDLSASQFEDAGIEETKHLLITFQNEMRQAPMPAEHVAQRDDPSGEVSALRTEIEAMRRRLEALEQGLYA